MGEALRFATFLSTLPARGATRRTDGQLPRRRISIHAPREGSDPTSGGWATTPTNFYPRSPRGERLPPGQRQRRGLLISIHAPREGSDTGNCKSWKSASHFYPRSPRGERPWYAASAAVQGNISIHAPREGSDGGAVVDVLAKVGISIHAPREGSDDIGDGSLVSIGISIHAPREGSDQCLSFRRGKSPDFYPRSPRGERHCRPCPAPGFRKISIHAPREGSDGGYLYSDREQLISIHAPREGSDLSMP